METSAVSRSNGSTEEGSVRLVDRVIDLLSALERAEHPVGLSEVSRATGIHMATSQRLLNALELRGFVQKERGMYQLGPAIVPLSRSFLTRNSLTRSAQPVLEELVAITGETASLYVRQGMERILLQRVESPHPLRFVTRIGERLPLHTGASGQLLMGAMPEAELNRFLEGKEEFRFSSGLVLTRDEMRARVQQATRQGFAVGRDERFTGIVSVGAPVVQPDRGTIAVVAVTAPTSRLTEDRVGEVAIEVRRAAFEVSERYRST